MAGTASATESALENQKIGSLQLRVAVLCTLVQICDGYDLNAVAWAVPSLIKAWHLPPPTSWSERCPLAPSATVSAGGHCC